MAEGAGMPLYIVHMSSAAALEQVMAARQRGVRVFSETCPQYLLLDSSLYENESEGAKYIMSPPLRERWNQKELWRGLASGYVQSVGTDHCPFQFAKEKQKRGMDFSKIPNGAPGVENRMSLIYNEGVGGGRISIQKFVEVTSTAAAKIFGLFPQKGTLAVGSDADVVVFDPRRRETISVTNPRTHHMRVDYNAYEGWEVEGFSETVISRGKIVAQNGRFTGEKGWGQFLKRRTHGCDKYEPVLVGGRGKRK
jgi:dihydropyrimidinase